MQAFQQKSEIKEDETEDFYKSYYDHEERLKQEQADLEAAQAAQAAQEAETAQNPEPEKPKYIEITQDLPQKDPEIAQKEGVAYWTKMCDTDEDLPKVPKKAQNKGSKDLPGKAQVDAQQAEQETWADRWYQNKKVQKVVHDSKIYSKVKANIKTKFVKALPAWLGLDLGSGKKQQSFQFMLAACYDVDDWGIEQVWGLPFRLVQ